MESISISQSNKGLFSKLKYGVIGIILDFLEIEDLLNCKFTFAHTFIFKRQDMIRYLIFKMLIKKSAFADQKNSITEESINGLLRSFKLSRSALLPIVAYKITAGMQSDKTHHYSRAFSLKRNYYSTNRILYQNVNIFGAFWPSAYVHWPLLSKENDDTKVITLNDIHTIKPFQMDAELMEYLINHVDTAADPFDDDEFLDKMQILMTVPKQEEYTSHLTSTSSSHYDDSHLLNPILSTISGSTMFINNIFYLNDRYSFNCPGRSFFLFTHDNLQLDSDDHNMLDAFELRRKSTQVISAVKQLDPTITLLRADNYENDYKILEFNPHSQLQRNLKVVCWVDCLMTKKTGISLIPFTHCGKFLLVKMVDTTCSCKTRQIDVGKFLFLGSAIFLKEK